MSFRPLISAVAAGITAIIKPSELTPHSSALIKKIVEEVFEETEVAVVEGAIETSQNLLKQPLNHIFFTGAPTLGKVAMEAASKHLASEARALLSSTKWPILTWRRGVSRWPRRSTMVRYALLPTTCMCMNLKRTNCLPSTPHKSEKCTGKSHGHRSHILGL